MHTLYIFLATITTLVIADLLWLGVFMKTFYRGKLSHLVASDVQWAAAIAFYIVFTAGLLYFAVLPNLSNGLVKVVVVSALLGGFGYATYDLTNHATLKQWPLVVTVVDIAWGMVLSGLLGAVAYGVSQWVG